MTTRLHRLEARAQATDRSSATPDARAAQVLSSWVVELLEGVLDVFRDLIGDLIGGWMFTPLGFGVGGLIVALIQGFAGRPALLAVNFAAGSALGSTLWLCRALRR